MKEFTRRKFFKYSAVGMAGLATTASVPMLGQRLPLAGPNSEFFTIAVISDTQFYNCGVVPQPTNLGIFLDQTKYLAEKRHELKLKFVTHVGDVVEYGDGSTVNYPANYSKPQNIEWLNSVEALDVLDAARGPLRFVHREPRLRQYEL